MKKYISILLLAIIGFAFKNPIKTITLIGMTNTLNAQSKYVNGAISATDTLWHIFDITTPSRKMMEAHFYTNTSLNYISLRAQNERHDSLNSRRNDGTPTSIAWFDNNGYLKRSPINSIPSNSDVYNAGMGLTKTGSSSPYTFAVDTNATTSGTSAIMYVGKANGAINALNNSINGKVPQSRNITINGTTQDLSVDRTWSNVGIELPTQTGQSGKYLTTNGTSPSWGTISGGVTSVGLTSTDFAVSGSPVTSSGNITANLNTSGVSAGSYNNVTVNNKGIVTNGTSLVISAPSTGNTFTSGTPFQPRSGGSCFMSVQSTLGGIVGVTGLVTVAMSPTSGGTYTTVSTQRLLISVLAVTADSDSGSLPIPAGYWVRITLTGGITATYTRWDF